MACFINNPAKAFPKPRTPREVPAWKYKSVLLVQEYHDPYGGPSHLMFSHNNKVLQGEEMLTRNAESIAEVIYKFHSASGYSKFPVHVFNYGEVLEKGQDAVRPLYTVTVDDYDRYMKEPEKNPLFLPKSLFDSYIVKSTDGSITVDRIQTIAGAERKVRELARKYPCVGFNITSAKHGGVVKAYAASVGKAPKVTQDNTREYKRKAEQEARESVKWNLRIDGKDYADYDSRGEAEREGKRVTKADGGRWSVRQVRGNPSPTNLTGNAHLDTLINEWRASGRLAFVYPKRKEVSLNGGSAKSYATTLAYLKECKQREKNPLTGVPSPRYVIVRWSNDDYHIEIDGKDSGEGATSYRAAQELVRKMKAEHRHNPLTGVPSHDIPLEMRHGRSQQQAIAIALEEQRRRHPSKAYPRPNPYPVRWYIQTGPAYHDRVDFREDQLKQANEFAQNLANETGKAVTRQEYGRTGGSLFYPKTKRGKKNPEGDESDTQAAAELYEQFHGVEPTGEVVYTETTEVPDSFAELGDLVELCVATVHGKDATIAAPDPEDGNLQTVVKLASSPDGRQLYLIGGDQSLDLEKLGFAESEERHHMLIGTLYQITYRTKKKFHKMRMTDYFHNLGEESGLQPALTYNPYNERMGITGGNYLVKPEGVVD